MISNRFRGFQFLATSLVLLIVLLFSSCKPSIPKDVLSKGEMEDILFDYHLVEAAAATSDSIAILSHEYKDVVLKDHGVSKAEFDSSMVYYARHTELLHDIYENLEKRLTDEAENNGTSLSDLNKFGSQMAKGDTADVWAGDKAFVLSTASPFNEQSFSLITDTAFHKGDRVILDFSSQFIFQDGMRNGTALIAVTFKNDSVAQQYTQISNSQDYTLTIDDRDSLGIKSIKGFFLLGKDNNNADNSTTLKMMFITNIRLIRMHVKVPKGGQNNNAMGGLNGGMPGSAGGSQMQPQNNMPQPQMNNNVGQPSNMRQQHIGGQQQVVDQSSQISSQAQNTPHRARLGQNNPIGRVPNNDFKPSSSTTLNYKKK